MAFLAAKDGFRRNVPESVAQLTGGEYFAFKDATTLSAALDNDLERRAKLLRPELPSAIATPQGSMRWN